MKRSHADPLNPLSSETWNFVLSVGLLTLVKMTMLQCGSIASIWNDHWLTLEEGLAQLEDLLIESSSNNLTRMGAQVSTQQQGGHPLPHAYCLS